MARRGDGWLIAVATLLRQVEVDFSHNFDDAIHRFSNDDAIHRAAHLADCIDCERRERNAKDHAIGLRNEEED